MNYIEESGIEVARVCQRLRQQGEWAEAAVVGCDVDGREHHTDGLLRKTQTNYWRPLVGLSTRQSWTSGGQKGRLTEYLGHRNDGGDASPMRE